MYDLVIKDGRVVDSAGNPWIRANVAIEGDRIVRVSRREIEAARAIDAGGLVVAPGFIDCHTHSDSTVLENRIGMNYLTQGVSRVIVNGVVEFEGGGHTGELAGKVLRLER